MHGPKTAGLKLVEPPARAAAGEILRPSEPVDLSGSNSPVDIAAVDAGAPGICIPGMLFASGSFALLQLESLSCAPILMHQMRLLQKFDIARYCPPQKLAHGSPLKQNKQSICGNQDSRNGMKVSPEYAWSLAGAERTELPPDAGFVEATRDKRQ